MKFLDAVNHKVLIYDGSKGVVLQSMGLTSGEIGELWNIDHPNKVAEVYKAYRAAGQPGRTGCSSCIGRSGISGGAGKGGGQYPEIP